jgi:excisionase family DNA binding protein
MEEKLVGLVESVIRKVLREELGRLNQSSSASEKLLTPEDACRLLHCSKPTLLSYRRKKYFPYYQAGNRVYYKRSEIESFLRTQAENS